MNTSNLNDSFRYLNPKYLGLAVDVLNIKIRELPKHNRESLEDIHNDKPCIYFLFDMLFGMIHYIGQTKNLKSRIKTHRKNEVFFSYFAFIEIDADKLHAVERLLINFHNPCGNKDSLTLSLRKKDLI